MKRGKLVSLPGCTIPLDQRGPSHRMFGSFNRLTVGKEYDVIDTDGSSVVVLDDDGKQASFHRGLLTSA